MPIDRGGLQYAIQMRDDFTKVINDWKKKMEEAKASWKSYKDSAKSVKESATAIKQNTEEVKKNREALKLHQAAQGLSIKLTRQRMAEEARQAGAEKKQITENIAAINKAAKAKEAADRAELRRIKAIFDERNRLEREQKKISTQRAKDEARELANRQRQVQAFAAASQRAEREAARISASLQKDKEKQKALDPQFQAQKRNLAILKEEAIVRAQIAQIRARTGKQLATGDLIGASKSVQQIKDLNRSLETTDRSASNLFFTFRRLVGVLAVFTIARNVVQSFKDMVSAGIAFNDKIIVATTSTAGLIAAVGEVRDEFGKSVDSTKEFALAQGIARKQVELLRQDALRTTATFEQLAETFQVSVAPGLTAGLDIDQVRKLTVSISQAAAAIGLQQNQLAEEVRSLLSGTIQARTTRIATALGITNADIRRLKESGELFDVLEAKLRVFDEAAQKVARSTLTGIAAITTGAFQKILGDAAGPLFQNLLKLGTELFDKVLTIRDAVGKIQPNPQVVKAFEEIFDVLSDGVDSIRELAKDVGFRGLRESFAAAGAALTTAIQFSIGFAQVLLLVLKTVVGVVRDIADFFGLTTKQLGQVAGAVGAVLAGMLVWSKTLGLIGLGFGNIKIFLRALIPSLNAMLVSLEASGGAAVFLGTALKAAFLPLTAISIAVGIVLGGFKLIIDKIFDIKAGLFDLVKILGLGLLSQLLDAVGAFKRLGNTIINFFSEGFKSIEEGAKNAVLRGKILAKFLTGNIGEATKLSEELAENQRLQDLSQADRDKEFDAKQAAEKVRFAKIQLGIEEKIAKIVGEAAGRDAQGEDFDPTFNLEKFLREQEALKKGEVQVKDFGDIISTAQAQVDALADALVDLQDELIAAGREFTAAQKFGGLTGAAAQVQAIFTQSDLKIGKETQKIQQQILKATSDINSLNARRRGIQEERTALGETEVEQLLRSKLLIKESALTQEKLTLEKQAEFKSQIADLQQQIKLKEQGRKSEDQILEVRQRLSDLQGESANNEARAHSLALDREKLEKGLIPLRAEALKLAIANAAIFAAQETPGIERANVQSSIELANQKALLAIQKQRQDSRSIAFQQAEAELSLTKRQLVTALDAKKAELDTFRTAASLAQGNQKAVLEALVASKEKELSIEEALARIRLLGLEVIKQQTQLAIQAEARELNRANSLSTAELANQKILLALQLQRTDARLAAVIAGQAEIDLTKAELQASRQQLQIDLAKAHQEAAEATAEEQPAADAVVAGLEKQLQLQIDIGKARIESLEAAKEEATLVAFGSEFQGIKRGFEDIAKELPTAFQRGIELAKGFVNELGTFIKGTIRSAFDPTNDQTIAQRFGAFLQGIGDLLLDTIIQAAQTEIFGKSAAGAIENTAATSAAAIRTESALALKGAAAAEVTSAALAASIRASGSATFAQGGLVKGFAQGGRVPDFSSVFARAQGLAHGGKPRHIPASDTVPAWLTPGEFVIRKRQVDRFGVDFFKSLNRGSFEVPRARGAGPSHDFAKGMAAGGTVSSQSRRRDRSGGSEEGLQILPVHVAGERELARQLAGGKSAFLRHLRENASTVRSIVQRGS